MAAKNGKDGKNTAAVVWNLVEPVAAELGLELWDVRFEKEGASLCLKLIIDKEEGVSLEDCEALSRRADKLLDEADPIAESYRLIVSSPGVERELCRENHFLRCMGEPVKVRFIRPVPELNGERDLRGVLNGYENGTVTLLLDEETETQFSLSETAYVRLDDFDPVEELNDDEDENEKG